jgi:hypothetical protein
MAYKTYKNAKGHTLSIHSHEDPESPREWDNLGTMAFFHGRYILGDTNHGLTMEEVERKYASKNYIALEVFMYDHSGITISTSPFSCPWDSGKIGVIFVSRKKVREEYSWKVITKKRKDQIIQYLKNEITTYDQYIRGDVYGYRVIDSDGEELDSCWGFFGEDPTKNGIFDHAGNDWTEQ